MHLLGSPPLLACFALLRQQPSCQLLSIRIQLARPVRSLEFGFDNPGPQIFLDRVARHACSPRNLANGHLVSQRPFPNDPQKSHVYHSNSPQLNQAGARLHMGQFSMTISAVAGSVLSDNQQTKAPTTVVPCFFNSLLLITVPLLTKSATRVSSGSRGVSKPPQDDRAGL